MRKSLLLTLAVMAAACASTPKQGDVHTHPRKTRTASKTPKQMPPEAMAYAGPTPVARPPLPTYTPPGAGAPVVGQPGYPGQGVPRSKDPRVLPPSPYPAIYAASGDGKKPVVRGLKPKAATDKAAWEECERLVAEAITDPATFDQQMLQRIAKLSDVNAQCVREHAMTACYLHLTAATKDPKGLFRSSYEQEEFREEMSRRKKLVCKGDDKDRDAIITAIFERGRLHDWKSASPANLNKAFHEGYVKPQWMLDNEASHRDFEEKQRKRTTARARTITTSRTTAALPTMAGYSVPLPDRALNACWAAAQQCMNGLGADIQALPDGAYECLRMGALEQCAVVGVRKATAADMLRDPKPPELLRQRAEMDRKWGARWGSAWDVYQFGRDLASEHCPKGWDKTWDAYFERMRTKCTKQFEAVFK